MIKPSKDMLAQVRLECLKLAMDKTNPIKGKTPFHTAVAFEACILGLNEEATKKRLKEVLDRLNLEYRPCLRGGSQDEGTC